jgi:hypothetical protein
VVSDRPILQWSPVDGATRYEVTLLRNSEPIHSIETAQTTLNYPAEFPSLEPGQTYRLEVKILDEIDYQTEAELRNEIEGEEFDSSVLDFRLIDAETRADLINELASTITDTTTAMELLTRTLTVYRTRDMSTARSQLLTNAMAQCNLSSQDQVTVYNDLYSLYRDSFKLKIGTFQQQRNDVRRNPSPGDAEPELHRCVMNLLPAATVTPPESP